MVVRRKMGDLLKNESAEVITQIKQLLLQALYNEHAKVVRKAIANLVIVLASQEEVKWVELLNYIDEHSTHPELEKRLDGS